MAARISLMTEEHWCEFCAMTGRKSLMQPHKPLRDHYYCTTCGQVEIDWPAIYPRVESLLYEYRCAKSRLNMLPAVKAIQYDVPYVEGGQLCSQQEAHLERDAHDLWVVQVVENTFRYQLTQKQRMLVVYRYFERWKWRQVAQKLSTKKEYVAESTVMVWRLEVLKEFAKTARWA